MSSAFDFFVSFVVQQFCASTKGTSLFSRPLVTLAQAAKIAKESVAWGKSRTGGVSLRLAGAKFLMNFNATSGGYSKQERLLHPPGLRAGSNALSPDFFVLFVSFVVKQFCASVLFCKARSHYDLPGKGGCCDSS